MLATVLARGKNSPELKLKLIIIYVVIMLLESKNTSHTEISKEGSVEWKLFPQWISKAANASA
jgi:hypothetical protein